MEPFKNLYSRDYLARMASRVETVFVGRSGAPLRALELDGLEMKARAWAVAGCLRAILGSSGPALLDEVVRLAATEPALSGFDVWPMTMVVEQEGAGHVEAGLDALYVLTQLFTGEFALRPLYLAAPDVVLTRMAQWVTDPSEHVRRLVSEGMRPRLPWGIRLQGLVRDPAPTLPLLEALRDDPSEYVRRSVANHLNDIAKDHPDVALAVCARWLAGAPEPRRRLVRHALRSLVKQGDPEALALMGAREASVREASLGVSPARLTLGESLHLDLSVVGAAQSEEKWVVDVVVHFVKANGGTSPKVFKGTEVVVSSPGEWRWGKALPLRPVTTRRHYTGEHAVEVQVNGTAVARASFWLEVPGDAGPKSS
jgi:3-methyladenine DNA glycosylase AlkC